MADERNDISGASHDFLQLLALSLLISVEHIWLLSGQPREHRVQVGFERSVPEHQSTLRVDPILLQEIAMSYLLVDSFEYS